MDDALALCAAAAHGPRRGGHAAHQVRDADVGDETVHAEGPRSAPRWPGPGSPSTSVPAARLPWSERVSCQTRICAGLTLNGGPTLLLGLPWRASGDRNAAAVARVGARGFQVLLARPERTPSLRDDLGWSEALVGAGAVSPERGSLSADRGVRPVARGSAYSPLGSHARGRRPMRTTRSGASRPRAGPLEEAGSRRRRSSGSARPPRRRCSRATRPVTLPHLSDRFGRRLFGGCVGPAGRRARARRRPRSARRCWSQSNAWAAHTTPGRTAPAHLVATGGRRLDQGSRSALRRRLRQQPAGLTDPTASTRPPTG